MKKAVSRFLKKTKLYLTLPEMTVFWVLFPLLISIIVINFVFLRSFWPFFVLGASILAIILVFINSLRIAKLNWEMKLEKNKLSDIVSNLSDGLIGYDTDFKIHTFNKAAEMIFGISAQELIGKYLTPNLVKDQKYRILIQSAFPSLAPQVKQISQPDAWPQILELSFEDLELRVITCRITDAQKHILGFFKLFQDQTREKQLLEAKSKFITVAAHQLRTPLGAVSWGLETLAKNPNLTTEDKTLVEENRLTLARLLKTVEDLLKIAQIEEGKFGYHFEENDLVKFIEEILVSANSLTEEYKVKLYFDKPKESVKIKFDSQKLNLALFNLIDNAIKYNVENGQITVKLEKLKEKPFVKISIKDTGLGIPAEEMDKLFTKFHRGSNIISVETGGTGLGLYITKNIIKNHGGEIWAESIINRGTTIYFTLPTDYSLIPIKETREI